MTPATAAEYALLLVTEEPDEPAAAPGLERLSTRERQLVTLVAQGRTNAQIAAQLSISVRTVRSHLDRIRGKTGKQRRADLTRLALQANLVLAMLPLRCRFRCRSPSRGRGKGLGSAVTMPGSRCAISVVPTATGISPTVPRQCAWSPARCGPTSAQVTIWAGGWNAATTRIRMGVTQGEHHGGPLGATDRR
jgi:DNA-binding CsgD family transcriptional regulator